MLFPEEEHVLHFEPRHSDLSTVGLYDRGLLLVPGNYCPKEMS